MAPLTDNFSTSVDVTVEFEDVDVYGIAHHIKLIAYLERARMRMLLKLGGAAEKVDYAVVMYKLNMRFIKPAFMLDTLTVTAFIKAAFTLKAEIGYEIRRGGELLATASTDLVFVNRQTKEVLAVPEHIRQKFGIHPGESS